MRSRSRTRAWRLVALLGVTACGGFTDPLDHPPIAGDWAGVATSPDVRLVLSLRELPDGGSSTLEGEGELSGAGPTVAVLVRGERVGSEVRLVIAPGQYMPIHFTGQVLKAGTRLHGMLLGSGIVDLPFVLERGQDTP